MNFFKWVIYHFLWVKEGKPSEIHWGYYVLFKYKKFNIRVSPESLSEWVKYEFEQNPRSKIIGPFIRKYKSKKYPFYFGVVRVEARPYKLRVSWR